MRARFLVVLKIASLNPFQVNLLRADTIMANDSPSRISTRTDRPAVCKSPRCRSHYRPSTGNLGGSPPPAVRTSRQTQIYPKLAVRLDENSGRQFWPAWRVMLRAHTQLSPADLFHESMGQETRLVPERAPVPAVAAATTLAEFADRIETRRSLRARLKTGKEQ